MPQANNSAREQLQTLEKHVKKIIRKSLKNNTLDYTVQITISNLEPGKIKYASLITSPARGVKDIIYVADSYDELLAFLEESEKTFNPTKVEEVFHENRINSYKNKISQHEERLVIIRDPAFDPNEEDDDIEMEQV